MTVEWKDSADLPVILLWLGFSFAAWIEICVDSLFLMED